MMSEQQRMIIGGLMKRLLNQIPAKVPGKLERTDDFQFQISNLYLMLEKRISVKRVFETSLDISKQKNYNEISIMTERIMNTILDFEAYCETEENEAPKRALAPQKVVNIFERKIGEKLSSLRRSNSNISLQGVNVSPNSFKGSSHD